MPVEWDHMCHLSPGLSYWLSRRLPVLEREKLSLLSLHCPTLRLLQGLLVLEVRGDEGGRGTGRCGREGERGDEGGGRGEMREGGEGRGGRGERGDEGGGRGEMREGGEEGGGRGMMEGVPQGAFMSSWAD